MNALYEIIGPSFLLRDAFYNALIIGLLCPLVGVFFVLRRMIFLGVALPQVSAAGIAMAFLLYPLVVGPHDHGALGERTLALIGSITFTLVTLGILAFLENNQSKSVEARIGTIYAISSAAVVLILSQDPHGEAQMVNLLKGDILSATAQSLSMTGASLIVVIGVLAFFRRQLLIVSFDRELAKVFRMRVQLWDLLLYLCIGLVISVGVMVSGPIVVFGFLVVPTLAARTVTNRMYTFALVSSLFGFLGAFFGFWLSYSQDLPLGPSEVACACGSYLVAYSIKAGRVIWASSRA